MNVLDYAMQMEVDGQAYYQKMAEQTRLSGLKNIFMRLADDEKKHYDIFRKLKEGESAPEMLDTTVLDDTRNVFEELPATSDTLDTTGEDLEAYRHAMQIEADSARLYEDAADKETDSAIRDLLKRIAEEERKHFNILDNIYQFVNAPNQYLAWGEFSNLDEFTQFGRDTDS